MMLNSLINEILVLPLFETQIYITKFRTPVTCELPKLEAYAICL